MISLVLLFMWFFVKCDKFGDVVLVSSYLGSVIWFGAVVLVCFL